MHTNGSSQIDLSSFDRYGQYTDLAAVKEYSYQPLRKCIRINTLKSSLDALHSRAAKMGWTLTPVPWCSDGFWIDRNDQSMGLGKDLLHLLGHMYMQEAASMLPVHLLNPQPGERILDMSAAPGSKTTQIAAAMHGEGVLVANDMDEKRLRTLQDALSRSGVINVIMTKRKGQWFGPHMTGRFDRVLIDAPCTAQGTIRKDPTALQYASEQSIAKAAALQKELLESAINATKIGGRIVYSTCTLAPEENEEVVAWALKKFAGKIEPVSLRNHSHLLQGIDDAQTVQDTGDCSVRLWPHTYDTEGFFCAVLQKTAPTIDTIPVDFHRFREEKVSNGTKKSLQSFLESYFGTSLIHDNEIVFDRGDQYVMTTEEVTRFKIATGNYSVGLPLGRTVRDCPLIISHELATLRTAGATDHVCEIGDDQLEMYLSGADITCEEDLLGHSIVRYNGMCIGRGRARGGKMRNHLPRWVVAMGQ